MPATALRECGWAKRNPPSIEPLSGWFWPFLVSDNENTTTSIGMRDFFDLYWKVHRLRASGLMVQGGIDPIFSFDGVAEMLSRPLTVAANEYDLIAPQFPGYQFFSGGVAASARFGFGFHRSTIPQGRARAGMTIVIEFSGASSAIVASSVPGSFPLAPGFSATFLGSPIVMYALDGVSGSIAIEVAPGQSYWSYNGKFDTFTGRKITR